MSEVCTKRFISSDKLLAAGTTSEAGETLCRWCRKPVNEKGRRWWHSDCVKQYTIRSGMSVRSQIFQRDNGICAECGIDCERLDRIGSNILIREARRQKGYGRRDAVALGEWNIWQVIRNAAPNSFLTLFMQKYSWWKFERSSWASAHIVAVQHGGGACGIENYRTLCVGCHNNEHAGKKAHRGAGE